MNSEKHRNNGRKSLSRREFVRLMGLTTGAFAAGNALPFSRASAAENIKTSDLPGLTVKALNRTAEEIYRAKKDLTRFNAKEMPFKHVAMEMGAPFFEPQIKSLMNEVKNSRIGKGVSVKSPDEARAHLAFNVGASTGNNMIGPYGEGHENMGQLSWTPLHVPEELYTHPLKNPDPRDMTKKTKQMARIYGADMTGVTRINKKWIFAETCRNMTSPKNPKTKPIVFKKVTHLVETLTELVIPESVENAIVFGPHVRIAKVLTDMPLVQDSPIDFGVTEYCETCGICAKECPAGAISPDRVRTFAPPLSAGSCGNPGALKWYVDGKKCLR